LSGWLDCQWQPTGNPEAGQLGLEHGAAVAAAAARETPSTAASQASSWSKRKAAAARCTSGLNQNRQRSAVAKRLRVDVAGAQVGDLVRRAPAGARRGV
jgi:hypothetical protein